MATGEGVRSKRLETFILNPLMPKETSVHIESISCSVLRIPLAIPTADAIRQHNHRDYALIRIHADNGLEGHAYCLEGVSVAAALETLFSEMLVGEDPFDTRRIWERMYRISLQAGRRGAGLRALSLVDNALWDLKGKALDLPLYKLLGGYRDRVPAYASGGYFREGKTPDDLAQEMLSYVEMGFTAVKMKVGRLSPEQDAERVKAVREAIGPSIRLMVDANNAWSDLPTALQFIRRVEPYDLFWLEEPTLPDAVELSARIAAATSIPIATGEIESTRWGFQALIESKAAAILQPDVTVVGGVTEFMRVADAASARDLPVAPHYFWDMHAHLIAALPNGLFVEHFVHDDIVNFDLALERPWTAQNGEIVLPNEPGFGLALDEDKIKAFTLTHWSN